MTRDAFQNRERKDRKGLQRGEHSQRHKGGAEEAEEDRGHPGRS